MNHMAYPTAFDARDTVILDAATADAATPPSSDVDTVEFGSGWYHDAAIVASEQASAQKH